MKFALTLVLVVILALLAPLLLPTPESSTAPADNASLPWHIESHADGSSTVFGLTLGKSLIDDATRAFGVPPLIAIVGRRDEVGALEAFFDGVRLGPLNGKAVVTAAMSDADIHAMRARALKEDYMESTTRRATLSAEDIERSKRSPIRAIVFVPAARLDDSIVRQRFGEPGEKLRVGDAEHYLYPARGLDIAINEKGKSMLQYVAPADFARVREPLLQQR
jgi:hypothetical protein